MIVLITDYGLNGPYIGQVQAAIYAHDPRAQILMLMADAPAHNPRSTAYLIPAYVSRFPEGVVFFCVVDPEVGTGADRPIVLRADGRWFVGPDNGLFDVLVARAESAAIWEITWRPAMLSASFHGRDLYAPVAAMLNRGERPDLRAATLALKYPLPLELDEIVYIDHFGNGVVGRRAATLAPGATIRIGERPLRQRATFGEAAPGEAFWYENANGLVEIAVNRGNAAEKLALRIGDAVSISAGM